MADSVGRGGAGRSIRPFRWALWAVSKQYYTLVVGPGMDPYLVVALAQGFF